MPWALKSLTPGMVVRGWTVRAKGLDMSVDLPIDSADGGVERIDVLEVQPHQKAVVMPGAGNLPIVRWAMHFDAL